MDSESDGQLLRRCADGDHEAFAAIVDRYKHSLVNYVTHMLRSRDGAEEIAQEAFVRLYQSLDSYRDQDRVAPYLFRIATNLVVSDARRAKRWALLLPRFRAGVRESAPRPDRELESGEIQRRVAAALERLPLRYRAPLVLFEIEEWSYEEIGKALEIRCGTVKSRIFRAREMLRKQLAPWWIGGERDESEPARRLDAASAAPERVARIHF